jgi:hypothetical protein
MMRLLRDSRQERAQQTYGDAKHAFNHDTIQIQIIRSASKIFGKSH